MSNIFVLLEDFTYWVGEYGYARGAVEDQDDLTFLQRKCDIARSELINEIDNLLEYKAMYEDLCK